MKADTIIAADLQEVERSLAALAKRGEELRHTLREGRIQELSANCEHLLCRPVMIQQPKSGERDLWFGLTFWDWKKFREEGFDGYMETSEGSGAPKIMILVEKAALFMEERCRQQAERRRAHGGLTAHAARTRALHKNRKRMTPQTK